MGDSVTAIDTPGADYTWGSATFAWDSATAGKPWANAHISSYALDAQEALAVAENAALHARKASFEFLSLTDGNKISRQLIKDALEALSISDCYTDQIGFLLRVMESITVGERLGNEIGKPFAESVAVSDAPFRKTVEIGPREAIAVAERFGRVAAFKLKFAESLSVAEKLTRAITLSKAEALAIYDEYLRRGNAVISDMIVATNDMTLDQFAQIVDAGHAPGFNNFRDFIPGDYDYQYAIFRAVLESINSDRARLLGLKLDIDIQDVYDRGSVTITNAATGVYVPFERIFHIPPEVTLTLKGGTVVAIPKIVGDVTVDGFTAQLFDTAGSPVTGSFTWAAHGY